MIYFEKQQYLSRSQKYLLGGLALSGLWQIFVMAAAELGYSFSAMGTLSHILILMTCASGLLILRHAGLQIRIQESGIGIRFFPYQIHTQYIHWNEIRKLRIISGQAIPNAVHGRPAQDFVHAYRLTHPEYAVLHVELINGSMLYVSTKRPEELLDFLQHGFPVAGMQKRYIEARKM